jgi:hypothetical protein
VALGGPNLGNLMSACVLLSTVILAVSLGIVASYSAVIGLLNAFGRQQTQAVAMFVPSESHASGD